MSGKAGRGSARESVFSLLRQVPKGRVATYAGLAKAAGTHHRAVASFMRSNPDPGGTPCFRVVMSDGRLGGYSGPGGTRRKAELLEKDGIEVRDGRVDLRKHLHAFGI
jgi:O-6-methylguanine DNA methyltransferase